METARCKAFLYAAKKGSLTKAADALGYTPSGVSQLITALEDDLGFKLLQRSNKGVTLTQTGTLMLPMIRQFMSIITMTVRQRAMTGFILPPTWKK